MTSKRASGFGAAGALAVIFVLAVIGVAGWTVLERRNNAADQEAASQAASTEKKPAVAAKKNSASTFTLPKDWKWYENTEKNVKIAYPKAWDMSFNFAQNLKVIPQAGAKLFQGCGDPACEVTYDIGQKKWTGTNVREPILPVKTNGETSTYLIPIKGAMYCGSWGLYVNAGTDFIEGALGMCSKNDDPNFQPNENRLAYETVVQDLDLVTKSLTTIR